MEKDEQYEMKEDVRMSNFSQTISIIFVTIVIGIAVISILFF